MRKIIPTLSGQRQPFVVVSISFAPPSHHHHHHHCPHHRCILLLGSCHIRQRPSKRPLPGPRGVCRNSAPVLPSFFYFLCNFLGFGFLVVIFIFFFVLVGRLVWTFFVIDFTLPPTRESSGEDNFLTFTVHWAWKVTHTGSGWQLTGIKWLGRIIIVFSGAENVSQGWEFWMLHLALVEGYTQKELFTKKKSNLLSHQYLSISKILYDIFNSNSPYIIFYNRPLHYVFYL